jgi:hypothetical protein
MSETARLADQVRRAFDGDAWHGDSVLELLDGVDAKMAAAHPIKNAHSIWELVLHIAAWDGAVLERTGGSAVQLTGERNFPPVKDASERAWREAIEHSLLSPARSSSGQDRKLLQLLLYVQWHRPARGLPRRPDRVAEKGADSLSHFGTVSRPFTSLDGRSGGLL